MATGQNIADEVRADLNDGDAGNLRWSDADMLRYINAAQRQIVMLVPEANVVEGQVTVSDAIRQALPAGGVKFIGVWNYDSSAGVRGPAIRPVERDAMDTSFPEWAYAGHMATHMNYPTFEDEHTEFFFEHFWHDPRDPKAYSLFPPTDGETPDVLLRYSKIPTALTALSDTYGLGDEYINGAVQYVMYRCLTKDSRFSLPREQRRELWDNFLSAIGRKLEADDRVDPATKRPPGDSHG